MSLYKWRRMMVIFTFGQLSNNEEIILLFAKMEYDHHCRRRKEQCSFVLQLGEGEGVGVDKDECVGM